MHRFIDPLLLEMTISDIAKRVGSIEHQLVLSLEHIRALDAQLKKTSGVFSP